MEQFKMTKVNGSDEWKEIDERCKYHFIENYQIGKLHETKGDLSQINEKTEASKINLRTGNCLSHESIQNDIINPEHMKSQVSQVQELLIRPQGISLNNKWTLAETHHALGHLSDEQLNKIQK